MQGALFYPYSLPSIQRALPNLVIFSILFSAYISASFWASLVRLPWLVIAAFVLRKKMIGYCRFGIMVVEGGEGVGEGNVGFAAGWYEGGAVVSGKVGGVLTGA